MNIGLQITIDFFDKQPRATMLGSLDVMMSMIDRRSSRMGSHVR